MISLDTPVMVEFKHPEVKFDNNGERVHTGNIISKTTDISWGVYLYYAERQVGDEVECREPFYVFNLV